MYDVVSLFTLAPSVISLDLTPQPHAPEFVGGAPHTPTLAAGDALHVQNDASVLHDFFFFFFYPMINVKYTRTLAIRPPPLRHEIFFRDATFVILCPWARALDIPVAIDTTCSLCGSFGLLI